MRYGWFGFCVMVGCTTGSSGKGDTADNLGDTAATDADADTDADSDTDADTDADTDTDTTVTTPVCYEGDLVAAAGYGAAGYIALSPGDIVPIVHGPQGGYHIETAISVENTHEALQVLPTVTVVSSGKMISGLQGTEDANKAQLVLLATGECSGTASGIRAYVDDIESLPVVGENVPVEICDLAGQEVDLHWDILDLIDGRMTTADVRVKLELDPIDVDDCAL